VSPAVRSARAVAIDALVRIDRDGAYANLVLPRLLERTRLGPADRHFVTELVYGTTRMRRACDSALEPYLLRPLDPPTRAALRVGAYQLLVLGTPAHAAVGETAGAVPPRTRGLVNAVLRRLATHPPVWPDEPTRLSYPDWIVALLDEDLGADVARDALQTMNQAPPVTERADGYVQDLASQWVAAAVDARPGHRVIDTCAAPGGKATALAAAVGAGGPPVCAVELRPARARLLHRNAGGLGAAVTVVAADGAALPVRPAVFDRVLVDAPCSGLGALRRRPDARWRIEPGDVGRLAELQRRLVDEAARAVAPGGVLVYSVCTLTSAETLAVDEHLADSRPDLVALPVPEGPWRPHGRGALLLPQAAGTDGMYVLRLCRN